MSTNNKDIVWPPQTTQDVLNLTPRKNRNGILNPPLSPSPLRISTAPPLLDDGPSSSSSDDDDDDDDEETLKLKLAQIEAKLKLKKLQKAKKKQKAANCGGRGAAPASPAKKVAAAQVEVPLSPMAKSAAVQVPPSPKSPSRVLLGIDKGLTGRDMSLRRAPQYRKPQQQLPGQHAQRRASPPRPVKSFSERIAEERAKEKNKYERRTKIEATRSKGFGLGMIGEPDGAAAANGAGGSTMTTSTTTTTMSSRTDERTTAVQRASTKFTSVLNHFERPLDAVTAAALGLDSLDGADAFDDKPAAESTDEAGFDSFSGLHLLRRITSHPTVTRHLGNKEVYTLPQLLKCVVSPDYSPPDVEGDWITLGCICSKSDPRSVGQNTTAKATGQKYMVMTLTDLKWELDLFLFGAGFERFWKLPVGTVLALLNPNIMKPRHTDTGRFSLTITDDMADSVLEIGTARDLGFCKSTRCNGKPCGHWVDSRHNSFCSFHVEATVKKTRVGRAEVNSMSSLFSPPKKGSLKPKKFFGRGGGGGGPQRDDGLLREGPVPDMPQRFGGGGGNVFVAPGRSTAALLDDEDYLASGVLASSSRDERLRKRLLETRKERELTKAIIKSQGREGGLGAEYLRKRISTTDDDGVEKTAARRREDEKDREKNIEMNEALRELREAAGKGRDVRLSPIKRKRQMTIPSGAQTQPTQGILVRPRSSGSIGSNGSEQPPVAKKTRFVLSTNDDDSDDDLDIVHE